jgi:hypothetical protein
MGSGARRESPYEQGTEVIHSSRSAGDPPPHASQFLPRREDPHCARGIRGEQSVSELCRREGIAATPESKREMFLCLSDLLVRPSEARVLRLRDWTGEEIRIKRGAKGRLVCGVVRDVKRSGGEKTLPVSQQLADWLEVHATS